MNRRTETKKRPQYNFMIMASLAMLIPLSTLISNSFQWKTTRTSALDLPFSFTRPSAIPKKNAVESAPVKSTAAPKHNIQQLADGSSLMENFDEKGRRVSKIISASDGALLNRWDFEPVSGRILRYETKEYEGKSLVQRRVARWQYDGRGSFIKTNHVYDSKGEFSKTFMEWVSAKNIKYQEKWYDSKNRLISEKNWDPESGRFVNQFMTAYGLGGWATQTYMDERGKELRKVLLGANGKAVTGKGLFQIGG